MTEKTNAGQIPVHADVIQQYGLACNYDGDSAVRGGAKCYVTWTNPGNGGERMEVWVRSRGGRPIVKIVNARRLSNFRVAWIPDHVRTWPGSKNAAFWDKETAAKAAETYNKAFAG